MFRAFIRWSWPLLLPLVSAAAPDALGPVQVARYGIPEGLSQSSVTALAQDRRGFLWVGTHDGLNRFDGHEFRVWRADREDRHALPDASIATLVAHPDGSVWCGTLGGFLTRHDPVTDRFAAVRIDGIVKVVVDRDGAVWVGSAAGLMRADAAQSTALRFDVLSQIPVTALAPSPRGGIWEGRGDGSIYWRAANELIPAQTPETRLRGRAIRALAMSERGELWAVSDGAAFARFDLDGKLLGEYEISRHDLPDQPRLRALAFDERGGVWLGGLAMGVMRFDPENGTFAVLRHRSLDPGSLSHDDVVSLLRDDAGLLWVGTLSGGLSRVRTAPTGLAHFQHEPGNPASLSHNTVTSFAHDARGAIWIGTDGGGLNRFDAASGRFERVPTSREAHAPPGHARIWSLHVDRQGGIWVGTWGGGLLYRPPNARAFHRVASVTAAAVTAFHEDGEGLWIATHRGLFRRTAGHIARVDAVPELNITAIEPGGDGTLWLATWSDGLVRFDSRRGTFERLLPLTGNASSLPHVSVRALAMQSDGSLWVGTAGGLSRLDPATKRFTHFGGIDGMPAGTVYGIEIDDDGRLWLGTNAGLVRFDSATGVARRIGPDDGAQHFEYNGGAHHRLPDGRLLFGGLHGFNLFEPRAIAPPAPPPQPQLVEILLGNRAALPKARDPDSPLEAAAVELESLTLGPRDNLLGIHFAAPLPRAPGQVRYAFRLDGFDADWRHAGPEERVAQYTNLPAGRYLFRVRAGNSDGQWSTRERTLALRVEPPWWASTQAYLFYTVAAALALLAFIQWRTRALRRRAALLEERVKERTAQLGHQTRIIEDQAQHLRQALETKERLFARVSHEFRTPLTLIMGPVEALLADERRGRTAAWLRLMRRNARRLLLLVDQLLGLARVSGEAPVQPAPLRVAPVVRGTIAAFASMAARKGVELTAGRLDDAWAGATAELLERMVTNLISNAVKYTPRGGHVQASVIDEGSMVVIVISDDGPGIAREEHETIFEPFHRVSNDGRGTGLGLALVRECAQALGGSVTLTSAPGQGATFSIRLPATPPGLRAGEATGLEVVPLSERTQLEVEAGSAESALAEERVLAPVPEAGPKLEDERSRVLIVEDDPDLRVLLLAALSASYRCETAGNGRLGIDVAIDDPPDLIVSDVLMPEVDGFELTRALKLDPRTSHVPIVLLTALGDRDSRLQGLEERADDYLVKPFDADELRLRVRNLIEARRIVGQRAARGVYDETRPIAETAAADETAHSRRERAFLERLQAAARDGHRQPDFGVHELARRVAMSERQLQRKLRALLGVSPAEYLREYRLQRAAALLRRGEPAGNVGHDVGFSSPSHFGACFKARFGVTPGDYSRHVV